MNRDQLLKLMISVWLGVVVLTACGPSAPPTPTATAVPPTATPIPATLFDPEVPPVAGQEITVVGEVESGDGWARLKVVNGAFSILQDENGKRIGKEFNGKTVEVRGNLTGEAFYDITSSLSDPTSGTVSGVAQVPELRVVSFKEAP